ncbi:MAG: hypothetical protein HY435_01620 [Candidatus Liptonbacteria bacterium]|nr:hypothetical protein [Candidatus Liptonbacteria bacterium]
MPGPYFVGQKSSVCGCYYPDVTRVRDEAERGERILFCITHGEFAVPLEGAPQRSSSPIPDEDWRAMERDRLRRMEPVQVPANFVRGAQR